MKTFWVRPAASKGRGRPGDGAGRALYLPPAPPAPRNEMSDPETTAVLEELRSLRERMDELYALVSGRGHDSEPARAGDYVGVDYVCRVTGLARVTVLQGKAGTSELPLQGKRPKRWLKRDVDAWQRARADRLLTPRQKALRELDRKRV